MSTDDDSAAGRASRHGIGTVTHFEEQQSEQTSKAKDRERAILTSAIETAHEHLFDGNIAALEATINEVLLERLPVSRRSVDKYDRELSGTDHEWHYSVVNRAVRRGASTRDFSTGEYEKLLASLESVAAVDGPLPSTLQTKQPVVEYRHQVGIRYLSGGQRVSKVLETIDPNGGLKATLLTGGQGAGKSTSLETIVEDRISKGNKIIDLVDFHKAENVTYDVPDQSDLSEIRAELGLRAGFEDYDPPDVEVLAPLSPDLSDTRVPVKEDSGESIVKPFTIPASELTYRQLVMLLPHTTTTHENYLRSAHQKLSNSDRDWTLRDVADVVRNETNAGDNVADRIERALQTAQQKSFIRDTQCPHSLEWDEIMADPSTVTAFTAHMIREPTDQLLVLSYLLDCVYDERKRLLRERRIPEFPTMTVVMREIHKLVPRIKSEQDNESTIEGYMIDTFSELISLMRHVQMELVCDTQKFREQLSPQVSGLFHRVFCFRGQKPDIKKVFNTRVSPKGNPEERISQYDDGVCALVSEGGYKMPIKFAPPRCHHLDANTDGDGFLFRTKNRDDETLEPSPWDTDIPERLTFTDGATDEIEEFFQSYVRKTGDRDVHTQKSELVDAFNRWQGYTGEDEVDPSYFHRRLAGYFDLDADEDTRRPLIDDKQRACWVSIVLDDTTLPKQVPDEEAAIEG